jgi:hypothetical protein
VGAKRVPFHAEPEAFRSLPHKLETVTSRGTKGLRRIGGEPFSASRTGTCLGGHELWASSHLRKLLPPRQPVLGTLCKHVIVGRYIEHYPLGVRVFEAFSNRADFLATRSPICWIVEVAHGPDASPAGVTIDFHVHAMTFWHRSRWAARVITAAMIADRVVRRIGANSWNCTVSFLCNFSVARLFLRTKQRRTFV